MGNNKERIFNISIIGVFSAIVVVLQCTLGLINVGTINLNFVLIPILVAGMMYGVTAGTVVGGAFGITVFIQCMTGTQAFGAVLLEINWFYCFILCVARGVLVGFAGAAVYKLISSKIKNQYLAATVSSVFAPIINTGFFILGYAVMYNENMHEMMVDAGAGAVYVLFIMLAGVNFFFELGTAVVLTPPIVTSLKKAFIRK